MTAITEPAQIKDLIATALAPYIGTYQVLAADGTVQQSFPAIWSAPPEVPPNYEVVDGLEVILNKNPVIEPRDQLTHVLMVRREWTCTIIDRVNDPAKTLQQATETFASTFTGSRTRFSDRVELEQGIIYPQTRIVFPQWQRLR